MREPKKPATVAERRLTLHASHQQAPRSDADALLASIPYAAPRWLLMLASQAGQISFCAFYWSIILPKYHVRVLYSCLALRPIGWHIRGRQSQVGFYATQAQFDGYCANDCALSLKNKSLLVTILTSLAASALIIALCSLADQIITI